MDWAKVLAQFNDLSQAQSVIAEKYGFSQSTISGLLSGDRDPNIASLRVISQIEGKPVWRLVQMAERYGREPQQSQQRPAA
jgi:transcriptional regulator with XRE-family HTH domain